MTTLLEACGETVHPASAELAPEAAGVDAEAGEHELHAFQMLRRLDEIFCANFMVFHDLVREEPFDVWIADEALGGRLLPAREPGAQDRALRLAHRLRRRAADARGRRARGVPRRRLQRARWSSTSPATRGCVTARSSSAIPTTSCRSRSGRACPTIRDWTRGALRLRRLHHRLRPGGGRRPRRAPGRARLRARGEGLRRRSRRLRRRQTTSSSGLPPPSRRRSAASRSCA